MLRVESDKSDWFWFQSIVFTKPFKNRMSLNQARGRDFLVPTKRSAASGDENGFVRLASEHAQSDGKSVNRGLPVLDLRGRDSWC